MLGPDLLHQLLHCLLAVVELEQLLLQLAVSLGGEGRGGEGRGGGGRGGEGRGGEGRRGGGEGRGGGAHNDHTLKWTVDNVIDLCT